MSDRSNSDPVVLERRFVPKGARVMSQGDDGSCAYLLQSGSVSVFTVKEDGTNVELARLKAGQIFGEMALLFDGPRTASVETIEDCNLIVITRQMFNQKLEKSDPTVRAMLKMLTGRIVDFNNTLISKKSDVDDLTDATRTIYDNIIQALPRTQQRAFQNSVLPKLEEFLDTIQAFKERYKSGP